MKKISFEAIRKDFLNSVRTVSGIGGILLSEDRMWSDARHSTNNPEIEDKVDDILFADTEHENTALYKKLNYLITIAITAKLCPDALGQYLKGEITFDDLDSAFPFHAESDLIDANRREFVLDFDSICPISPEEYYDPAENYYDDDEDEEEFSEEENNAVSIGLSYLDDLYDSDRIQPDDPIRLSEALDKFSEAFRHVMDFGQVIVGSNNDDSNTHICYIYSEDSDIHIMLAVNTHTEETTILNPATGKPMSIDIYAPWWKKSDQ